MYLCYVSCALSLPTSSHGLCALGTAKAGCRDSMTRQTRTGFPVKGTTKIDVAMSVSWGAVTVPVHERPFVINQPQEGDGLHGQRAGRGE